MPLVVRDLETGLFYGRAQWTSDPEFADNFPDYETAKKFALDFHFKNVDILIVNKKGHVMAGVPVRGSFTPSSKIEKVFPEP